MITQNQYPFGKTNSSAGYILPLAIFFGTALLLYRVKRQSEKSMEEESKKIKN